MPRPEKPKLTEKEWERRLATEEQLLTLNADAGPIAATAVGVLLALGGVAAAFADDLNGGLGEFMEILGKFAVPALGGLGGLFTALIPKTRAVFTRGGIYLQHKPAASFRSEQRIIPYSDSLRLELIRRPGRGAHGRPLGRIWRARLHHRGIVYRLRPAKKLDAAQTRLVVLELSRLIPVRTTIS